MWHYAERPRKGPLIFFSPVAAPLQRVPKTGVHQALRAVSTRVNRRVNLRVFARFGVSIGEDGYADLPTQQIPNRIRAAHFGFEPGGLSA